MKMVTLDIIGLLFNITGAVLMFYGTPKISSKSLLYNKEDRKGIERKDRKSNLMIRIGIIFLFFGFLVQLISLIIKN